MHPTARQIFYLATIGAWVTGTWCAALTVSRGSPGGLAGWWAALLAAAAFTTLALERPRRRTTLALAWLGAVPLLWAQALYETTPPSPPRNYYPCGMFVFGYLGWPFVAGACASSLAVLIAVLRHRLGWPARVALLVLATTAAASAPVVALVRGTPQRIEPEVLATLTAGADRLGEHRVAGFTLRHERQSDGVVWRPAPQGSIVLVADSIELVSLLGAKYLRPAGSSDVDTWAMPRGDRLEVDLWGEASIPPPTRARAVAAWTWVAGVALALTLLLRRRWLARCRDRLARGVDGMSDGEAVWLAGARLATRTPAGPVVVLPTSRDEGSYRGAPSVSATFVRGTKHGRRLRWLASMERMRIDAVVALALTSLPALLHALHD